MKYGTSLIALLAAGCAATGLDTADLPPADVAVASAYAETEAVASMDDAADDPAIWINRADPAASRVLGTDKQAGLYVYDLQGAILDFLPAGQLNNVDIRQGVALDGYEGDLAAASNRSDNTVTFFAIDPATGETAELGRLPTGKTEPYGFCLGYDGETVHAFVTYKDGAVQRWRVSGFADGAVSATAGEGWKLETQLEGCAADEENGQFYIGEEMRGFWRAPLSGGEAVLVDEISGESGLTGDVEGIDIYEGDAGTGWIVVSSQGSSTFNVYDRAAPNAYLGRFALTLGEDMVTGTDGLDVAGGEISASLPEGLLVVQDDVNSHPGQPQNYKLVDWREVMTALEK
ncbi:phytase [Euryhalocaulis caribicus]|uniref:phytase n=1 Tax=Euryhalocaulis caribicus TaxID=1161401 RepID=UPI0003A35A09|nr:phytase [Euryhalocaulis caribicus]